MHKTRNDTAHSSCGNAVIFGHTIATARLHEVPLPSGNTKVWLCYIRAMLLDALRVKREAILALGTLYGARHIRVFGSVARGEERPDSDVDFLVDFPRGYDMFGQRLALTERLAGLVGRRVEVVPEHELNRHIRSVVLKEAVDL